MAKLDRRKFLASASLAAGAATTVAAPALAQANPEVRWRMPMFVPKSLEVHWNELGEFAQRVADSTDGKFQIQRSGAGEIVPGGPAVLDAVEGGTVECGYTLAYYSVGKDPTYAFATTLPFGLNTRLQLSWWLRGGGSELMGEFFKSKNLVAIPIGNSTAQMGGWFRKEIKTLADLKGLKMRIPGLAGRVMATLGAVPQQLPAGEIYSSLERGTIDAAEWAHPAEDERMGFQKVAPYYYAPGWWEPNAMIHLFVNTKAWDALPKHYQAIVTMAALATHQNLCAKYDQLNSAALRRLIAGGAKLSFFSNDILEAAHTASFELFDQLAKENANFAKVYGPWKKFLDESELYQRVAEHSFESFAWTKRVKN